MSCLVYYHPCVNEETFRFRFCKFFKCPDDEYEKRVLNECLYAHARLLAPIARQAFPSFSKPDRDLVQHLGAATTRWQAQAELVSFQELNREAGFLRRVLRLRISGRKVSLLTSRLLERDRANLA